MFAVSRGTLEEQCRKVALTPHFCSGGAVQFQYVYDAASNETHRYTHLTGVTIDQAYGRDSLSRMSGRWLKRNGTPFAAQGYTYQKMNWLVAVVWGSVSDLFDYYWNGELRTARYGVSGIGAPDEGGDPDADTIDTADPWANYQSPEIAEPEPAPPPDDTSPPDLTPDTTPAPGAPTSDTPPAEDPNKTQKTVEDYLGDANLGPTGADQPDVPTGRNVGYNFDKAGNRTSVTDNVNGNASYVQNTLNQYTSVSGSAVTNGNEHEIRTYDSVTYTYINDEHLKQVTSGSNNYLLYYDALGRCVKRTLNGLTTYYIYDGEKPILEYRSTDLSNPAKNLYGKGIDEPSEWGHREMDGQAREGSGRDERERTSQILMRYNPTLTQNKTFYYQQDHEGSVTHLLNTSGNVLESYKYDAFGAPVIYDANGSQLSSSAYSNRFLFTGREYANLFGFYEYRSRAYNPTLGRFMSEDRKLFDAGDYNLFRYCHNDPIDFTDPMGLTDRELTPEVFAAVRDASVNSYNDYERVQSMTGLTKTEAKAFGRGLGRSQGIYYKNDRNGHPIGKPILQKDTPARDKINIGKVVGATRKEALTQQKGAGQSFIVKEEVPPVAGYSKAPAVGHMHADVTGNPAERTGFSTQDQAQAFGKQGSFVGLINESEPGKLYILIPQQEGGPARQATFDLNGISAGAPKQQ